MEQLKIRVGEEYSKYGLTLEILELSQLLDIDIAREQRRRLEEFKKNK